MDRSSVSLRRITVDDYPLFSKEESKEVLEHYIDYYLATDVPPIVLSHDKLPDHPVDVYSLNIKWKPKYFGE